DVVLGELMEVGLGLLQADEIRLLLSEPTEETFAGCGPNAAAVHCDDAHGGRIVPARSPRISSARLDALTPSGSAWHRRAALHPKAVMQNYQLRFIDLALARDALRFGSFKLKSGRESPYFFNAGLFSDGQAAAVLGQCYAAALLASGIEFDVLFGPAYKGIPLVTTTAIALAEHHGRS